MSFPAHYVIRANTPATRRDGEVTRAKVLEVAAAHISAAGFHKMTIANVAADAQVSQSGLLHHFPSKAALLAAVLDEREYEDGNFLFGDGLVPLGWDAFESLVALAARNSTRPELVELFVRISAEATVPDHPAHEWLHRHYAGMRSWLRDAVAHGIKTGAMIDSVPISTLVDTTIAVLDGIQQQWILDHQAVSMVDNVRDFVDSQKRLWTPASQ